MLPPAKSAMGGPSTIGQVQSNCGNVAVPPPVTLTLILFPVAVQVEAAHSAKRPWQIVKS
jgi:hypothetical protein